MTDLGFPISYEALAPGTPVLSSDGETVGSVVHVLADEKEDVFDGVVIQLSNEGHRFADADDVASIHERGLTLKLTAVACESLHEPSENPAVIRDDPTVGSGSGIERKLRRAWDLLSGNY
jgi:PRC-barrel domain protein